MSSSPPALPGPAAASYTALAASRGNPVAVAAAGALPPRVLALANKVEVARRERLSFLEALVKWVFGVLFTVPFLGLTGFTMVPANTTLVVFRFGKVDAVVTQPGITWLPLFYEAVYAFVGTQTYTTTDLQVIDAAGNPIIVRALLEYAVSDPAALRIATNGSLLVLFNAVEQVVREGCSSLPLLGEHGHDIRSSSTELGAGLARALQVEAAAFGVTIQRVAIVEARYAPEIAAAMLMRQQAAAQVAARKEVVAGALGIVRDTLTEYPNLSGDSRERLVSNLLVTLTSHAPTSPVLVLS